MDKIHSVEDFFNQLPPLKEELAGFRFYRGQPDKEYSLIPSVFRKPFKGHESDIYNKAITNYAQDFVDLSRPEILSKMQHYDVPTRMLDITENPLVALYFACYNTTEQEKDGAVYCLKTRVDTKRKAFIDEIRDTLNELKGAADFFPTKTYDSDAITLISCLPKFNAQEQEQLHDAVCKYLEAKIDWIGIRRFNAHPLVKRLLHEVRKEYPAFSANIEPIDLMENYFYLPRRNNSRIIRQSGAFLVFGLLNSDDTPQPPDYGTREYHKEESYRIIIDHKYKNQILLQLRRFGISTDSLFPELYKMGETIKKGIY